MGSIKVVHTTLGKHGNYNSGSRWVVTLANGDKKTIPRKVARRLVTNKTKYAIEYKTKIYLIDGEKFYNIKWKGFKKPSIYPIK